MLSFEEKLKLFTTILSKDEVSYADSFDAHILLIAENYDFKFLEQLEAQNKIENWITQLKNYIVMKEDDATLEDIINDYLS